MYSEFITGGFSAPVSALLTGHRFRDPGFKFGESPAAQEQQRDDVDELLSRLMKEKKIVLLNIRSDRTYNSADFVRPPMMPDAHAYGLLGYRSDTRTVRCFNPWGNDFKPKGPPGMKYGYPTRRGQFDMPLQEFMMVFRSLSYETDEPLGAKTLGE